MGLTLESRRKAIRRAMRFEQRSEIDHSQDAFKSRLIYYTTTGVPHVSMRRLMDRARVLSGMKPLWGDKGGTKTKSMRLIERALA